MIRPHGGSAPFLLSLVMLLVKHARLGATGTSSFLAADLCGLLLLRGLDASEFGVDFIQQDSSGQEAIERLRPFLLALDPHSRWPMVEYDTG